MNRIRHTAIIAVMAASVAIPAGALPASAAEQAAGATMNKTIAMIMGEPNFTINGGYQDLEDGLLTKATIVDNTLLSPLKEPIEKIGGTFEWSAADQKVTITLAEKKLELVLNKMKALVNGVEQSSSIAPQMINGRIYLPVRFVMENLGGTIAWEDARSRVVINIQVPSQPALQDLERGGPVTNATMLKQADDWYGSEEAKKVAEVVLGYQNSDGGWMKLDTDVNMTKPIYKKGSSTIDNNATFQQMRFLARAYNATKNEAYKDGFTKGLEYVLSGQYENGGWPQFFPNGVGYQRHITYNDNAMTNILEVLRDVMNRSGEFTFADDQSAEKSRVAYNKGIEMILRTQIEIDGKKTAWCAQYDENTLQPAVGRAYELESISGQESVNIVRFLMGIEQPSEAVIDAIQSAVAWLDQVKVNGIKVVTKVDPSLEFGSDRVVEKDAKAPALWARFYEIGTNKPMFSSRDGIRKYQLADINYERRVKYSWYNNRPRDLLSKDYPQWRDKWSIETDVLQQ